jgi:hypothetical protein
MTEGMRVALVENGVVVNVIMAGEGYSPPDGVTAIESDTAGIGYRYDGKALTRPADDGPPAPLAWPPAVIIAAIKAINPAKARAILANADEITKAEFFTARLVREDDARLLAAISAVGITMSEVKAAL